MSPHAPTTTPAPRRHRPRLRGGGKAEILEVYGKDRPCGSIRATTSSQEELQGGRLRLAVVRPEPAAAS